MMQAQGVAWGQMQLGVCGDDAYGDDGEQGEELKNRRKKNQVDSQLKNTRLKQYHMGNIPSYEGGVTWKTMALLTMPKEETRHGEDNDDLWKH